MFRRNWRPAFSAFLLALAIGALLVACGAGQASGPTAPTTIPPVPTATPAGFLAIPTAEPTTGKLQTNAGSCPPYPAVACTKVGEDANLFNDLPLDRVQAMLYVEDGGGGWILDKAAVQYALQQLDGDVTAEPYTIDTGPLQYDALGGQGPNGEQLILFWPEGEGIPAVGDKVDFAVDRERGLMGHKSVGLQWSVPPEFFDALFASYSDMTPTPSPTRTPQPTPEPTISVVPSASFNHPSGRLVWSGPDQSVTSNRPEPDRFCTFDEPPYGLPRFVIHEITPEDLLVFAWAGPVAVGNDWRWTGYSHGSWQIWQGDNPRAVYLLNTEDTGFAFEYFWFVCF